jgi:Tfp pilus assembly protein PilN
MTTTALPPAPAPAPRTSPVQTNRFVAVRANLLPPEIADKRRLRQLKQRSGIALLAIVALLAGWYVVAMLQTSSAHSGLTSAQHRSRSLLAQEQQFGPVVTAQAQSAAIRTQLAQLMVGDVNWTSMLKALRQAAPTGVQITNVTASIAPTTTGSSNAVGGGLGVLNQTGQLPVGTLTIAGKAPDKNSVAAYVDRLTKVPGLAAPCPASVNGEKGAVTFTANVIITNSVLGGRFTSPARAANSPSGTGTSTGGH